MRPCPDRMLQHIPWALRCLGRYVVPVYMLSILSGQLFSQSLSFKNFSDNDVLPSSTIYTAFQDSKGLMWFASDRGVCRYDGYAFTNYTTKDGLADNEVFDFFEDNSGRIWFHTLNGKTSYFSNGEIFNATKDTTLLALDSDSNITAMFEDAQGNLWIAAARSGLVCALKNGKVQRFFRHGDFGYITSIFPLDKHRILLTSDKGIFKYRINTYGDSISLSAQHALPYKLGDPFAKVLRSTANDVLVKMAHELYIYDTRYESLKRSFEFKDKRKHINNLCQVDEHAWICTSGGAVPYVRETGELLPPVLADHRVSSVFKDREGNYWITTLGDGIFFSTSLEMFGYTSKNGLLSDKITCLSSDTANGIWVGYDKTAVSRIYKGKVHTSMLCSKELLDAGVVYKIHNSGSRSWIAASLAFFMLEDDQKIASYWGVPARDIIEYPKDHLWLAAGTDIVSAPRKSFDLNKVSPTTLDRRHIKVVLGMTTYKRNNAVERTKAFYRDSRHTVWAATEKNLYRSAGDSLVPLHKVYAVTGTVNGFADLGSTVVAATAGNGIAFIRGDSVICVLGEEQGLSSGICSAVATDNEGVIWVATQKGLNKISGYPDSPNIEYFTIEDGLFSNEISGVLVAGDTIWVATKKGLNFFHRDRVQKKITPPEMYIDGVMLQGIPVREYDARQLVFEHRQNDIGIRFTGVSYNNGGNNILYRYRLSPDAPWRYTRSTSVYLPELPPGDYQFAIACRGKAGDWGKQALVSFIIEKPFWQTYTFMVTVALILIMGGWTVISLYLNEQRKKIQWQHRVTISELRTLRAQMNPHFLFNALNSIQGILLKSNVETAQEYLGRFGRLMRLILEHSDKTTVTISEELESITNYLEIEQLRSGHQFEYTIEVAPEIDAYNTEVPAMIVQPFIENAIHHGLMYKKSKGRLLIQFMCNGHAGVDISIRDNGIGRKMAMQLKKQSHKSKGIQLVRERIDILNSKNSKKIELDIHDLEDEQHVASGTLVTIKIPSV